MTMDSAKLSARARQPGHDRGFVTSETNFVEAARASLDPERYTVEEKPDDLRSLFGAYGVVPDASIKSSATGRAFFVEAKRQGPAGNADERASKHHTVQFYKTMRVAYPDYAYHPYVTILCESLATDLRYTSKAPFLFEPDHYFLWADYDPEALGGYLRERCAAWLDE